MPSIHGPLTSPTTGAQLGVWGGRFSIIAQTGSNVSGITDANFSSKIIRASNHIIVTPANSTARAINFVNTTAAGTSATLPYATMTNNTSILLRYTALSLYNGQTAQFYFVVFAGGTNT